MSVTESVPKTVLYEKLFNNVSNIIEKEIELIDPKLEYDGEHIKYNNLLFPISYNLSEKGVEIYLEEYILGTSDLIDSYEIFLYDEVEFPDIEVCKTEEELVESIDYLCNFIINDVIKTAITADKYAEVLNFMNENLDRGDIFGLLNILNSYL